MPKVLIVDDASDFGRFLKSALTTLDPSISVQILPSAEEALLIFPLVNPDLLIADYRLPGMSGLEMIRKVRSRYPDTSIIIVTALPNDEITAQAQDLKVDAFFRKPMPIDDFMTAVRNCLYKDTPPSPLSVEDILTGISDSNILAANAAEQTAPPRLPDVLSQLRQRSDAQAVLLVDDVGHILAQAGNCIDIDFESDWIPSILAALTASKRVALLLGIKNPEDFHTLRGETFDLLYSSIGQYALLVVHAAGRASDKMTLLFEEVINVRGALMACLGEKGVSAQSQLDSASSSELTEILPPNLDDLLQEFESDEPQSGDFEALFKTGARIDELKDADTFWEETLANSQIVDQSSPDVLSYDQARKLGLAPGDEAIDPADS